MKLLSEIKSFDSRNYVVENKDGGGKSYFIEGIFMQGGIKNRNGRVYPTPILEREMNRYTRDFIDRKRSLGELGHPNGPTVNADRASHLITSMRKEDDNFIGKAKILDTPMGKIVKNLLDEGVEIGVSTRGLGSVKESRGLMEVQDDFMLATVDIVTDPSGPQCFVDAVVEDVDWVWNENMGWQAIRHLEETKEKIKSLSKRELEENTLKMFESFINTIRKS